jgi:glycosyltransferase involved in cell wall biosynthesis
MLPEVSIIMPCLNEELTIGVCIKKASQWLDNNKVHGEILVGNNNSTDNSGNIAIQAGATVIDVQENGFGAAIYHTVRHARGKYLIIGDADDSYDFLSLEPFLLKLREGYDVVIGNRYKGGMEPGAMPFMNRYLGNPILSYIGRHFFGIPVSDLHCGLRAIGKDSFMALKLETRKMEFATELLIKSKRAGYKITEVPTKLKKDGRQRPPNLRPWRDGWLNLKLMITMYFQKDC